MSFVRALPRLGFVALLASTVACGGGGGGPSDAGTDLGPVGPLSPIVTTEAGDVTGERQDDPGVNYFPNIPYAAAPTGANRFRPPQPPAPWATARAYDGGIHQCPQVLPYGANGLANGSEDCLFLNVVTPSPAVTNAPVVVWLHGGGFSINSSEQLDRATDGKQIAAHQGVIVVTFNYRLGQLGFLAHPALSAEQGGHSGNYGMLDQIAALRWVKRNIAAFGGDPNQITVYGQSAGAMSICGLMASPLVADTAVVPAAEQPLFHRAMLQSSPCDVPFESLASAESVGTTFAQLVGCDDAVTPLPAAQVLACLRNPDATMPPALTMAEARDTLPMPNDFIRPRTASEHEWGPILDGYYMPQHPMDRIGAGTFLHVPVIAGYAKDEGNTGEHFHLMRSTATTNPPPRILDQATFDSEVGRLFAGGIQPAEVTAIYGGASAPSRYKPASYTDVAASPSFTGTPSVVTSYEQAFAAIHGDMDLTCPARRTLRALEAQGVGVHAYFSSVDNPPFQVTPVFPLGAFHSSDVQLVFGSAAGGAILGGMFTLDEQTISDLYQAYFFAFARTGDPNGGGRVAWPAYTPGAPTHLRFAMTSASPVTDPRGTECAVWDGLGRARIGIP